MMVTNDVSVDKKSTFTIGLKWITVVLVVWMAAKTYEQTL